MRLPQPRDFDLTLAQICQQAIQQHPARILLKWRQSTFTVEDVIGRASVIATNLKSTGVTPGSAVGVMLDNHPNHVATLLAMGLLEPEKARVNVRGVLRVEGGAVKKYIAEIAPSSLTSSFSRAAMGMALGLTEILGDIVIPAPIERIDDMPMVGLAVRSDQREPIGAHRVLILVQGTGQSTLDGLGVGKTLQE